MSIEFPKGKKCACTAPTFGCQGCIDQDREKAIRDFYFGAPRPECPEGHGPMMAAEGNRLSMTVSYSCADEDCPCGEEVPVK